MSDGIDHVVRALRGRLAPLGVEAIEAVPGPRGGHLMGTCRIGPPGEGVVDADLRHHEVENLFVADDGKNDASTTKRFSTSCVRHH